jgi:iron complex outermembrane receptor protein
MSELIQKHDNRATIRWKLLTGVSALALGAYVSSADATRADEATRPPIWIELGGQFSSLSDDQQAYLPPFVLNSQFDGASKVAHERPSSDWDEGAKISFQPSGSDWLMSLGIRYGKSTRRGVGHQYVAYTSPPATPYQDSNNSSHEKHLILDFQAGKDFGLGMFGHEAASVLSVGVRYAQFNSRTNVGIHSVTGHIPYSYYIRYGSFEAKRSFRGVGPSLSWDGSANLAGNLSGGSLAFDWGVNGALLFGRQRVKGQHTATALYQTRPVQYAAPKSTLYRTSKPISRSKNVTIPDLGGYAALSLHYTNCKISFGYRADMFFGAMDGGIDARKNENRGFLGPYASISIGLGD